MGGWNYEALKGQPHTLGGTPRVNGRGALNPEGMTYKEWLAAAGAINVDGRRIADMEQTPHLHDHSYIVKTFSRDLRREWKAGVDPTEYRNYFEEEFRRLEEKKAEHRARVRADLAARRLRGDGGQGTEEAYEGDFHVGVIFRFRRGAATRARRKT